MATCRRNESTLSSKKNTPPPRLTAPRELEKPLTLPQVSRFARPFSLFLRRGRSSLGRSTSQRTSGADPQIIRNRKEVTLPQETRLASPFFRFFLQTAFPARKNHSAARLSKEHSRRHSSGKEDHNATPPGPIKSFFKKNIQWGASSRAAAPAGPSGETAGRRRCRAPPCSPRRRGRHDCG